MNNLERFSQEMLPVIEKELQKVLDHYLENNHNSVRHMLAYHMGWEGEGSGVKAQGKRIRPLLSLITADAVGSDWRKILPFACAIEMVHNYSLIHDDIEDHSTMRRGRETVWVKWGVPQAINAGDSLYTLAHLSLMGARDFLPHEIILQSSRLLDMTCLELTQGQYLDMRFENENTVTLDDYWKMISGKTAALISCCCQMGALSETTPDEIRAAFAQFGHFLGLAFQVKDDYLGLWGDTDQTGKSIESDLVTHKKTLPILYALQNNENFHERWNSRLIQKEEVKEIAQLLIEDGTSAYTHSIVEDLTFKAQEMLKKTGIRNTAVDALDEMTLSLVKRKS
jgi:geranylgeranyl diphosphate synthase type I